MKIEAEEIDEGADEDADERSEDGDGDGTEELASRMNRGAADAMARWMERVPLEARRRSAQIGLSPEEEEGDTGS